MNVTHEAIPEGSFEVRVFDGEIPGKGPYKLSVNLRRLDEDTAEVSKASGEMSAEINILLGLKAIELGFKTLNFYVVKGSKATRWSKLVATDDTYDYYTVDLEGSLARYLTNLAL